MKLEGSYKDILIKSSLLVYLKSENKSQILNLKEVYSNFLEATKSKL